MDGFLSGESVFRFGTVENPLEIVAMEISLSGATIVGLKEFETNLLQSGYVDVTAKNAAQNGVKLFKNIRGDRSV